MEQFCRFPVSHLSEIGALEDGFLRLGQLLNGFFDLLYALLKFHYFFLSAEWRRASLQACVAVYGLVVSQLVKATVAYGRVEESDCLPVVGGQTALTQHLPNGLKDAARNVFGLLLVAEKSQRIEI